MYECTYKNILNGFKRLLTNIFSSYFYLLLPSYDTGWSFCGGLSSGLALK